VKRLAALALLPLAAAASAAPAPIRVVSSESELSAAAASGGRVVLRRGAYAELVVPPRSGRLLDISAQRGTRVGRFVLDRASDVAVRGIIVAPHGGDALLEVRDAARVRLDRIVLTAAGTRFTATLALPGSRDVTVSRSEFAHCGDASPEFANCVLLSGVSRLRIEDSRFHDCLGCDFVHGRYGRGLTLLRNRFERALPCRMGGRRCMHQDLVELFSGKVLDVERNVFGVYRRGGAQLYVTNDIDDVRVANNLFLAADPRVPGYRPRVAIVMGSRGFARVPHRVWIVNNTILSGARRIDGYRGSIRMSTAYGAVPKRDRPVVANNVIALLAVPHHVCEEVQHSARNVVLVGRGCSRSDVAGKAYLDARGRPTAASVLLIGTASRRYAPRVDFTGRPRDAAPDVGAFEYRG
jgi:hypothetical protein